MFFFSVLPSRSAGHWVDLKLLQDIQNSGIPNIDVSLTGPQLREVVRRVLMPAWNAATYYYPLIDSLWTLRDKAGVDLVTQFPAAPALQDACMALGPRGQMVFRHGKKIVLVVMLTARAYELVEEHIEESKIQVRGYLCHTIES
jgi:hypothetical protein